jgi:hypothetical protein
VVQFAYHSVSRAEYAIKFFVSTAAFKGESNQYMNKDSPLVQFLPKMHAVVDNSNGDFQDAFGRSMPPCIVMEKGESLDKWVLRNKRAMDMFTCMQVQLCSSCVWQFDEIHQDAYSVGGLLPLQRWSASHCSRLQTQDRMQIISHICECLVDLHQTGYVHRDLKPANIMWLPSQNRWTLIDFGCAARIDKKARTGFSLMYAAPEAVRAHFREDRLTIQTSAALDAWSIGVIAVELFAGRPPLAILQGQVKVRCVTVLCLPQAAWLQQMQAAKHCAAIKLVQACFTAIQDYNLSPRLWRHRWLNLHEMAVLGELYSSCVAISLAWRASVAQHMCCAGSCSDSWRRASAVGGYCKGKAAAQDSWPVPNAVVDTAAA